MDTKQLIEKVKECCLSLGDVDLEEMDHYVDHDHYKWFINGHFRAVTDILEIIISIEKNLK